VPAPNSMILHRLRALLVALVLASSAGLAPGQDPAATGLAEELLDKIVAAQIVEGPVQRVEGYALLLNIRERGETRREYDLDVLYRVEDGGLIRIGVQDQQRGTKVAKGFDGRRYWLQEEDGQFHDLSGREYAKDRDSIDEGIGLAEELLLVFDLDRLRAKARNLVVGRGGSGGLALGGNLDRGGKEWSFLLHLAADSVQVLQLELIPPGASAFGAETPDADPDAPQSHRYSLLKPRAFDGRLLPQLVNEFYGADTLPARQVEIRSMKWRKPPARADLLASENAPR